jgi:molybdenum cofactor synthesis domain-containing protein
MTLARTPTAAVLVIGNEILSGRTQDSNLNVIAKKLEQIGIRLSEARIVPDVTHQIVDAVNALRSFYDYVFTTGGIGPTHDDITVEAIAKAFDLPVIENPEAREILEAYYTKDRLNAPRLRMALTPKGASLISNPISAAPGFRIGNVYVLAGVPNIMQAMMDDVIAGLQHGPAIRSITISGMIAESLIAEELSRIAASYPQLDIGSYPWFRQGNYGTALVVRGTDTPTVTAAADEVFALVARHGGNPDIDRNTS